MGTPRVRKHFEAALPVLEGPHRPQNPSSCWGCWSNTSHSPQEPWGSSAGRFLPSSQLGPVHARHSLLSSATAWDRAVLPERLCLRCWPSTKEFIFKLSQHTANSECLNLTHSGRAKVGAESQLRGRKGRKLGRGMPGKATAWPHLPTGPCQCPGVSSGGVGAVRSVLLGQAQRPDPSTLCPQHPPLGQPQTRNNPALSSRCQQGTVKEKQTPRSSLPPRGYI